MSGARDIACATVAWGGVAAHGEIDDLTIVDAACAQEAGDFADSITKRRTGLLYPATLQGHKGLLG